MKSSKFQAPKNAPYLLFLTLLAAGLAQAAENRWSNSRGDGNGKWENAANWSLDIPPNISQDVVIAVAISETVTIDATTAALPNTMFTSSLRVGRPGTLLIGTDTLRLLNAGLTTPLVVFGSAVISNRGVVTITGSALHVKDGLVVNGNVTLNSGSVLDVKGNIFPAYDLAVDGRVTLNGGLLTFSNDNNSVMAIGNLGRGSMNILAGELRLAGRAFLDVGGQTNSVGTLTIAGGTARIEGQRFAVGNNAGSTGSVVVAGGELITTQTFVGGGGLGQLTISNGMWRANTPNTIFIGPRGILALAGGTSVVSSPLLTVGNYITNSAESSLLMTGGTLFTTNSPARIHSFAGISNGVWRASHVFVGGGELDSSNTGRMVLAGGITTITNLSIGSCGFFTSTGFVTVVGGELIVTNAAASATLRVGNGVFRIEGGTVIVDTIDLMSPCARFERTGGTLIYRTALLDPMRDDDGDGASNGLEQSHGTDPLDPIDKRRDSDGDGAVDVDEILAGTDRFNSNSVFKIISILPQGEDVRLRWKTVAGKTNIIQAAERLGGSNIFEDLATVVLPGTGDRTNTFIEADGAIKGPSRFYRVKVIP